MKTNPRKQNFLQNKQDIYLDQDDYQKEIEMTNVYAIHKNNANYMKLQQQTFHNNGSFQKNPYLNLQNLKNSQKVFANKPVVPNESYNDQPNKIVINGMTFIHKDAIRGQVNRQVKTKKPQMQVMCQKCFILQMVPGNTHSFICFNCNLTQDCVPQYGIFICGSCQRKVWYRHGISDYIKCTRCGTINKIPTSIQDKNGQILNRVNPYIQGSEEMITSANGASANRIEVMSKQWINYPQI